MNYKSNYNPLNSCHSCKMTAQKRNNDVRCISDGICSITKSREIPPELNEHSLLSWETYEDVAYYSGIDGMTGYQKMDKFDWVIDQSDRQLTQDEYNLLKEKVKLIHLMLVNLRNEDMKKNHADRAIV